MKETDNIARISVCPRCGQTYHGRPAVSRADGSPVQVPCSADRIHMAVADMVLIKDALDFLDGFILVKVGVFRDGDVKHYTISPADICTVYVQNPLAIIRRKSEYVYYRKGKHRKRRMRK